MNGRQVEVRSVQTAALSKAHHLRSSAPKSQLISIPATTRLGPMNLFRLVSLVAALGHSVVTDAPAQGILGHDCQACHLTQRQAMSIAGHQGTADFGAGPLKVFRVKPGQAASVAIDVKDGRDRYAIGIIYPFPGGLGDTNRQLSYQPDPAWSDRRTFFATPTTNVNQGWTYQLQVLSNAVPDFYLLTIQTAGITTVASGPVPEWNHLEKIYVQVAPTNQSPMQLSSPERSGMGYSVRVTTTNGLAYALEFKSSLTEGSWMTACQVPGDGSVKTLHDTNAFDGTRFYRVRVE